MPDFKSFSNSDHKSRVYSTFKSYGNNDVTGSDPDFSGQIYLSTHNFGLTPDQVQSHRYSRTAKKILLWYQTEDRADYYARGCVPDKTNNVVYTMFLKRNPSDIHKASYEIRKNNMDDGSGDTVLTTSASFTHWQGVAASWSYLIGLDKPTNTLIVYIEDIDNDPDTRDSQLWTYNIDTDTWAFWLTIATKARVPSSYSPSVGEVLQKRWTVPYYNARSRTVYWQDYWEVLIACTPDNKLQEGTSIRSADVTGSSIVTESSVVMGWTDCSTFVDPGARKVETHCPLWSVFDVLNNTRISGYQSDSPTGSAPLEVIKHTGVSNASRYAGTVLFTDDATYTVSGQFTAQDIDASLSCVCLQLSPTGGGSGNYIGHITYAGAYPTTDFLTGYNIRSLVVDVEH